MLIYQPNSLKPTAENPDLEFYVADFDLPFQQELLKFLKKILVVSELDYNGVLKLLNEPIVLSR